MSVQVQIDTQKCVQFAQDMDKYITNLANTANVFVDIVEPVAKKSGSPLLETLAKDTAEVRDAWAAKARAARVLGEGMEEYNKKMERLNTNG